MIFTRKKGIAVANPESSSRTQTKTNIHEGSNTRRKVFTREHNNLFIQQVLQYSQEEKSDELRYHVLGLNESTTEDNKKKPIVPWLFDFT